MNQNLHQYSNIKTVHYSTKVNLNTIIQQLLRLLFPIIVRMTTMRHQIFKSAFWALTALTAVALAGLIGYHQGFARSIGLTDLERSFPSLIADGIQMLRESPSQIFTAGLASTSEWLIAVASTIAAAAFLAIALIAVRTPSPNSTDTQSIPYSQLTRTMTAIGEVLILLIAIAHFAWTVYRHHQLGAASILDPNIVINSWIQNTRIAAGIDLLSLTAIVIWLLVALRLPPVYPWLRVLVLTISGAAVALTFAAASISVGTITQFDLPRPVVSISSQQFTNSNPGTNKINPQVNNSSLSTKKISPQSEKPADNIDTSLNPINPPQLGLIIARSASHLIILKKTGNLLYIPSNQTLNIIKQQNLQDFLK